MKKLCLSLLPLAVLLTSLSLFAQPHTGPYPQPNGGTSSATVFAGNPMFYVAPNGSDANTGTSTNSPFATLHFACQTVSNLQVTSGVYGQTIHMMSGYNSNELSVQTNVICVPPNIGLEFEAGAWLMLTNRSNRNAVSGGQNSKNQCLLPAMGDVINHPRIFGLDSFYDTAWFFGGNGASTVVKNYYDTAGMAPNSTNPCIVNNLEGISYSAMVHFENFNNGPTIIFNDPVVVSQGQAFLLEACPGQLVINNPTTTMTNWTGFLLKTNSQTKPWRAFELNPTLSSSGSYAIVNGGTTILSDANSQSNWPVCLFLAGTPTGATLSNVVFNGHTIVDMTTNVASFNLFSLSGATNAVVLNNVSRSDGRWVTETNGTSPSTMINPASNVRSFNFPFTPIAITPPATTIPWTNTIAKGQLFIDNTGVTMTVIKKNGVQFSQLITDASIPVNVGDYVSETYTIGTPSWVLSY